MAEINEEIKKLIEENALALATIDEEGTPHCIAVGFAKVFSGNEILITDNYMLSTPKNIQKNPNVALSVWNTEWKEETIGYELIGKAEYHKEGKWYKMIKEMPENEGEACKGAILIKVEKIKKLA